MTSFEDQVRELFEDLGLIYVGELSPGRWIRCKAHEKKGKPGSYRYDNSHGHEWVYVHNWSTGESRSLVSDRDESGNCLSKEERAQARERMKREFEKEKRRRELLAREAAVRAVRIWNNANQDIDHHPYLDRKDISPGAIRKVTNSLVIPLTNSEGAITTLEFILPDGQKRYITAGIKKGSYFLIPQVDDRRSPKDGGVILLAEGWATARSLNLITGYASVMACDAFNLIPVARAIRKKYSKAVIVICADYDKPCTIYPNVGGTGVSLAKAAARAIQGLLAICPLPEGMKKADFDDLRQLGKEAEVRQCIEEALASEVLPTLVDGFEIDPAGKEQGLFRLEKKRNGTDLIRIGDPLEILAQSMDRLDGSEGLLLAWISRASKRPKEMILPKESLAKPKEIWLAPLLGGGWQAEPDRINDVLVYLMKADPVRIVETTPQTGWTHDLAAYVMQDEQFRTKPGRRVIYTGQTRQYLYQKEGTFEKWQETAKLAQGNPILVFALACAFAGPLLRLVNEDGGGFTFEGHSSTGKTTAELLAISVWGGPDQLLTWDCTANALEALAADKFNDNLMPLDELGTAGSDVGKAIYKLAAGKSRHRCEKNGNLRPEKSWRTLVLSTGEIGIADKLNQMDQTASAGQDIRLCGIPVEKDHVKNLHGLESAGKLMDQIKRDTGFNYGHAGPEFLKRLTKALHNMPDIRQLFHDTINQLAKDILPPGTRSNGQIGRVARRFALVAFAGQLACEYKILPDGLDCREAARICLEKWLSLRDWSEVEEHRKALDVITYIIDAHVSRFQKLGTADEKRDQLGYIDDANTDSWLWLFLKAPLETELRKHGVNLRTAVSAMHEAGWLEYNGNTEKNHYQYRTRIPGKGRPRLYAVRIPDPDQG